MIIVLSCCDLLVVLTNHPLLALSTTLWLTEKFIIVYPRWLDISLCVSNVFVGLSLLALLVMNFDRYLATYYPIFHRTSVTKRKLLSPFGIPIVIEVALTLMSVNDFVIVHSVFLLIWFIFITPPMLFINYKLFTIARKSRRNNRISSETKKSFSFKNISSCLLAAACFVALSIPMLIYIVLRISSKEDKLVLDNAHIAAFWAKTILSINSTFNCLIFYWKNKILRKEAMKLLKHMKICRRFRSQSDC